MMFVPSLHAVVSFEVKIALDGKAELAADDRKKTGII
jgi:hypothetical protein